MDKIYIGAEQLLKDSLDLTMLIVESGYRPDLIIGVWRGGTPVAITIHEALAFMGWECDHFAIRTVSYTGIGTRAEVKVKGLQSVAQSINLKTKLLLIDDVYDSGQSMAKILEELRAMFPGQMPEVKIAVPYFKPGYNTTQMVPDFYIHETDEWIVFPHELVGLADHEIASKPGFSSYAEKLLAKRRQITNEQTTAID